MAEVRTIILHHKRNPELINDEHLFSGSIDLQDADGVAAMEGFDFVSLPFRKMMVHTSRYLRDHPNAAVVLRRFDRKGLQPIQLGEEMRVMLRDDPVMAIRHMDVKLGSDVKSSPAAPVLRSDYDTLADAFGERVFVRLKNGAAEDPVTGKWRQLACGPKCGWRIRGEQDSYQSWLPIRLEGADIPEVSKDATEEEVVAMMNDLAGALAKCQWCSMLVTDLLEQSGNKFFLPRRWNAGGQWVGRQVLQARLDKYLREREEASC